MANKEQIQYVIDECTKAAMDLGHQPITLLMLQPDQRRHLGQPISKWRLPLV